MGTYNVAGYSRGPDGAVKFRVAQGMNRVGVLARNGHTEISLVQLPYAMDRLQAQEYVAGRDSCQPADWLCSVMSHQEAARVRAEFCERVRIAYEAN